MLNTFRHLFAKSTLLDETQYQRITQDGRVIEQDERGSKVIILANGDFFKIFRARHQFSGARIYSHARRFYRNALRLKDLNIPTVKVKELYHFEKSGHTAVLYEPLPGKSLREIAHTEPSLLNETAEKLGAFLAKLHLRGIHFHSLHTGNILLLTNQQFGLIDISDMSIFPWPLMCNTRFRSFKRLCKYQEDIALLGPSYWNKMLTQYYKSSLSSPLCRLKIESANPFLTQ